MTQNTQNTQNTLPKSIQDKILARIRARAAEKRRPDLIVCDDKPQEISTSTHTHTTESTETHTGIDGSLITYNSKQQEFVDLLSSSASCVLIGSAGTGKTTCTQGAITKLIQAGHIPLLQSDGHKHLESGAPGILIVSFTRRAVANIKKVLPADLKQNCITIHKLLEYTPTYTEVTDPMTGLPKTTMTFLPSRNAENPLPDSIHTIIMEEASMTDLDLFSKLVAALQHSVQWVFIGDIQQLPPVFGSAILGYKMLELPMVQLTEVYRQALESPIIRLAQRILSGKPIPAAEYPEWHFPGKLKLHPWKKKISADDACMMLASFFTKAMDSGDYDIDEDMILIPYNKACGTLELNKYIANHSARKRGVMTYEIMAGFNKVYFSPGDKVLLDKEDAEIRDITSNPAYSGAPIQEASKHLDYWGMNQDESEATKFASLEGDTLSGDVDDILSAMADAEDRVSQASHRIEVYLPDSGTYTTIYKAADVNKLLHAYALTVHKAQGSEWRKVYCCFHQSHATMLQRELIYTAVTRAREELYVICEPETFTRGILSQKIKGDTLEEKAEWFKGRLQRE